ncbi:very-short-patch-repair endonuclease [Agromyces terreus]|uniref:Very-short-patch-repair endonuclease n=1 Tax=Agromyces terreus TaxID=424795 RepID=A0A9X2KB00_9MICO|nr:type IV toxin-antitoxin system AbiEi family antitoxin domain-containing protein [Agromyces terreus]MCP2369806.1 very-short-patch-repair endonuclease [Agromyces terreus]
MPDPRISVRTDPRAAVEALEGAATTAELRAAGVHPVALSAAVHRGELDRVRRGWYALPSLDPSLRAAIRVGGRLACASAAGFHGWAVPPKAGTHVVVHENASRLRLADAPDHLVLHWMSPTTRADRSRLVTDPFETVVQLAHCVAGEFAVAAYDSFLARDPVGSERLEEWIARLPPHLLRDLPRREALCHSFLETVARVRLARRGIRGAHQVEIAGVGRVDLVIDGWLVIEWDGRTHLTGEQYDEDRRRDALLTARGYRVLRFSYSTVMHEWYLVEAAVRAMLDETRRTA